MFESTSASVGFSVTGSVVTSSVVTTCVVGSVVSTACVVTTAVFLTAVSAVDLLSAFSPQPTKTEVSPKKQSAKAIF